MEGGGNITSGVEKMSHRVLEFLYPYPVVK